MNTSVPDSAMVLVVDDDQGIRDALCLLLEDEGYAVQQATRGSEALSLLRSSPHRLVVLLDYLLPDMNGLEILHAVDDDPHLAGRHAILLMTAHRSLPQRDDPLRLVPPSVSLITKPFDLDDMVAAVARAGACLRERVPERA